jgi:hypothetical protein
LTLQPWEAYTSDTSIDITKHHQPKVLLDKIAYWTVKSLRVPTDIFFQVHTNTHVDGTKQTRFAFVFVLT